MQLLPQAILLFALNFLDAVLTLYWVRNGYASEGNSLMAKLLDMGDFPFLLVKICVGAIAAIVFWRWSNLRLAKYGLGLTLAIYIGLMAIHFFTGLSACGLISENMINDFTSWSHTIFAFIR